jgi:hypothetical protein
VILKPNQNNVNETLKRVTDDPNTDRRVRMLVKGAKQHHRRYNNESHIPRHVKRDNRL